MLLQKALPVEPEHSIAAAKSADHLAAHVSLLSQTPCGTLLHTPLLQVRLSDKPLGPFSGNLRFDNKLETIVRPLAQIADQSGGFNGESGQFSAVRAWPASSRALQVDFSDTRPSSLRFAIRIRGVWFGRRREVPERECASPTQLICRRNSAHGAVPDQEIRPGVVGESLGPGYGSSEFNDDTQKKGHVTPFRGETWPFECVSWRPVDRADQLSVRVQRDIDRSPLFRRKHQHELT